MVQANQPNFKQQIDQINELINKNTSGLIVLPANPSPDAVAASTSLYLALTKLGKVASIVCSTTPQSDLIGTDKIKQSLAVGGDNLVVSFPYSEGAIDKVDYNIAGERFNLVIIPREGFPKLDPKKVEFSYVGGKIEFIITIDAPNLNSLGPIYQQHQREFEGKNLINIDRHLINNNFGLVNYVNKTSSSTSELVLTIIETLKVEIDKDMATNLYAGLVAATNGFTSYSVNADTFQTASKLLRYGAVKRPMPRQQMSSMGRPPAYPVRPQAPMPRMTTQNMVQDAVDDFSEPMPTHIQTSPAPRPMPASQVQAPQRNEQQSKPIEDVEQESASPEQNSSGSSWLKPKIFPGKGLI